MRAVAGDGEHPQALDAQNLLEWARNLSVVLTSDVRDWQVLLSGRPPEKE